MLINELTKKLEQELKPKRELKPKDNSLGKLIAGKFVSMLLDSPKISGVSYQQHLENDTNAVQNAPEEETPVHKRERVRVGTHADGKPKYVQVSGDNQDERNDNIVRAILASPRRAEFVMEVPAIVQAKPEEQPKELHPLDKVAWEWYNNHLPLMIQANKMKTSQLSPIKSHMTAHVIPFFADKPVENIKHADAQEFLLSQVNPKTEEFYSKKVIDQIKSVLKRILDYAVVKEYIEMNPMSKAPVINPSDKRTPRIALTPEELMYVRNMIPKLNAEMERLYITMLSYQPYRRCEALGQKWEEINFDKMTCDIRGGVIEENGIAKYQETTKTEKSRRTMIAPGEMMDLLRPYRKERGFVLNTNGKHLKVSEFNNLWKSIKAQIPLLEEKGITPYCFRHTVATIMYHATKDIVFVQEQCGHTDVTMTRNYIHDNIKERRAQVEKVEQELRKCAGFCAE